MDAITGISVWGNFPWEKWYQEQQFWFSSLFSMLHFVGQCRGPQFTFQLELGVKVTSALAAHNYGKPKLHSLSPSVTWKKEIWSLDIVSQISNKDRTKIADLALIFLIHYTDTSYCIHTLWEECPSLFIGPPCIVLNFYIVIRAHVVVVLWLSGQNQGLSTVISLVRIYWQQHQCPWARPSPSESHWSPMVISSLFYNMSALCHLHVNLGNRKMYTTV